MTMIVQKADLYLMPVTIQLEKIMDIGHNEPFKCDQTDITSTGVLDFAFICAVPLEKKTQIAKARWVHIAYDPTNIRQRPLDHSQPWIF